MRKRFPSPYPQRRDTAQSYGGFANGHTNSGRRYLWRWWRSGKDKFEKNMGEENIASNPLPRLSSFHFLTLRTRSHGHPLPQLDEARAAPTQRPVEPNIPYLAWKDGRASVRFDLNIISKKEKWEMEKGSWERVRREREEKSVHGQSAKRLEWWDM